MMSDQDKILNAISDPGSAKILAEIWKQIEGEPLAAARMMRAFQGAKSVVTETLKELPEMWKALDEQLTNADLRRAAFTQDLREFRAGTGAELAAAVEDLKKVSEFFSKLDDDEFLNKANRLIDLCEKLQKFKRDGTLDWLKSYDVR